MIGIDLEKMQVRDLTAEEAKRVINTANGSANLRFMIETLRKLEVGQGKEIGPFPSENIASTFRSSYLSAAGNALGWPRQDEKGNGLRKAKAEIVPRDGQFYLQIVRLH